MNTRNRLKELRIAKGLSQNEVAKIMGVGRTTYLKWESGENQPTRKLKELSEFFGVSIDYLLGNSPDPSPESGGYYTDPDVAQITEELRTDPDKRILFDATKDLSKDDINTVLKIIEGLKAREKE